MSIPIRPILPVGRPPLRRVHLSPPSSVLYTALSGPLSTICHGFRSLSYIAAYRVEGDCRLMTRSIAPTPSLTKRIFFHVLPPSVVLNTPRSALRENRWPIAATYTTSGFVG